MAPNLGWRDVPLGERLARRARRSDVPDRRSPTTPTSARSPSTAAAPRVGADDVLFVSGEVGVGGGADRRRPAADGRRGLRRRDRPHAGQPGRRRLPLRLDRLLGDRGRRGRAAALARADRPDGGRGGVDAVLREAAGRRRRSRSTRSSTSAAGSAVGLAGLVNIFNPRADRARRRCSAGSIRSSATPSRPSSTARALPAPRGSCASCRRRSAPTRRSSVRPELAFEPLLADPAGFMARPARRPALASAS